MSLNNWASICLSCTQWAIHQHLGSISFGLIPRVAHPYTWISIMNSIIICFDKHHTSQNATTLHSQIIPFAKLIVQGGLWRCTLANLMLEATKRASSQQCVIGVVVVRTCWLYFEFFLHLIFQFVPKKNKKNNNALEGKNELALQIKSQSRQHAMEEWLSNNHAHLT